MDAEVPFFSLTEIRGSDSYFKFIFKYNKQTGWQAGGKEGGTARTKRTANAGKDNRKGWFWCS